MNLIRRFKIKPIIKPHSRYKGTSSAEYCLESVKKYDYENFICTLLLKNSTRSSAFAIRSFNVEVARVEEQVSDKSIGTGRLQFWEDTLNHCFTKDAQNVPRHPVAIELYKAISRSKLTKRYLSTLIACRKNNFAVNYFQNLEAIEKYAEQSISNVFYLLLEGSNVRNVHADHAASHLGKAQGIVWSLRCVPIARRINKIPLPLDVLAKNQVSQEDVLRNVSSDKLNDCVYEVASRAHQHLVKARSLIKDVPNEAKGVLLPAVPVAHYLDRLQKVQYDVFHPRLKQKTWTWFPKLYFNHMQNKY